MIATLLICQEAILAVNPTDEGDAFLSDALYPKGALPGFELVETEIVSDFIPSNFLWVNGALVAKAPWVDPKDRTDLAKGIDSDVDRIYQEVQGNRGPEYLLAETEASAYKASGYTGLVPSSVASWATVKSWTSTQATDDILATASSWRAVQAQIRSARLMHKELAKGSGNLKAVRAQWDDFVKAARSQLGL